jgi:ribonuclease HI
MVCQPQFLLFCDTHASDASPSAAGGGGNCFGRWHFVLDRLDRPEHLEAADSEPAIHPDRLALLSVVRGLEALDEPSQVNLVTTSRYVSRGLKYGLSNWRESDYQWERFGIQKPVRNADLWQRVDRALKFHGVTCRLIQSAAAPAPTVAPAVAMAPAAVQGPHWGDGELVTDELAGSGLAGSGLAGSGLAGSGLVANRPVGMATAEFESEVAASAAPPHLLNRRPLVGELVAGHGLLPSCGSQIVERPLQLGLWLEALRVNWWGLAISWIKWWRGRYQHRPLYFGT